MTNKELLKDWYKYGVETKEGIIPLRGKFAVCWGWNEDWGGLMFDVGDWSGEAWSLVVEGDNLLGVNPQNHEERNVLGKLVVVDPDAVTPSINAKEPPNG